jgi:hypothetical protein
MKMAKMWGLLLLGIAPSIVPIVEVLYVFHEGIGSFSSSSLVMGGMIGAAALIASCISLFYFFDSACEKADEAIGPINTVSGLALWGAAGIVTAVLLVAIGGRMTGIDTSFLLLGHVLLPGLSILAVLIGIGAVCAGTTQHLRFKLSPKLHLSKELER